MTQKRAVIIGAIVGCVLGFLIGGIWGWSATGPFTFSMEQTPREPPPFKAMAQKVGRAIGSDTGNGGSLIGSAIGVPAGTLFGVMLAGGIWQLLAGLKRQPQPQIGKQTAQDDVNPGPPSAS